jgi:UDP-N-acetylmuramate: L-alanyl-gamma-D-glutamyl-meso-diaminopimelate ligase
VNERPCRIDRLFTQLKLAGVQARARAVVSRSLRLGRKRIHLIGVCGTAMATLAALLRSRGHDVQGSDQNVYPPMSDFLAAEGIRTLTGYAPEHITDDIELVVVGNAISRGNPELETVLERKVRYCSLPEIVRDEFLWTSRSIVLAGTHGKTTTTSLTGWLLTHARRDPTVLVGGIALNFGDGGSSYRVGQGPEFVIEGDEYDSAYFDKTAKFLKYVPDVAVVGNIEFDHADIYADLDAVLLAFRRLVNLVPRNGLLLLGADSPHAAALAGAAVSPVETFGLDENATWRAESVEHRDGVTRFLVRRGGDVFGHFESPLLGLHNVRNALAAIAVGTHSGSSAEELASGLRAFKGIKRRLETVGVARGVSVLDDFAHHPTAVRETLAALRTGYPDRRIWAVFEPRSASSCRSVFQADFAEAFGPADEVVIAGVFRSSLPEAERLSADRLVGDLRARGQRARHVPEVDDIVRAIAAEHRAGDVVVLMSNGGFGGIHRKLLQALET